MSGEIIFKVSIYINYLQNARVPSNEVGCSSRCTNYINGKLNGRKSVVGKRYTSRDLEALLD